MTITQLEYVLSLNTFRNFAKAAKNCYVTQPTLSMQVKKLEEELGVILFDRSKKPVLPTDIGQKIIDQAKIAISEVEKINELVRSQKDELSGVLRIGIIPTLSQYLLPLFLSRFMIKYPSVELVLEEALSDEIAFKLNNDLLDVGIIVTPFPGNNLVGAPMFYESFVGYINRDHPLSSKSVLEVKDLKVNEMWLLKEGHCFRNQMINICGENSKKEARLKFESGSLSTLMTMVEQQSGYTLLPELATINLSKQQADRIRPFSFPAPQREISMVAHRSYIKRKLIGLLRNEIMENLPERFKKQTAEKVVKWAN